MNAPIVFSSNYAFEWNLTRVLCLASLLYGCSAIQPSEYKVEAVDNYPYSETKEGVVMAVQPLTDSREIAKYFGTDLLAEGLLPVLVVVENRGVESSYMLSRDNFSLMAGMSRAQSTPTRDKLKKDSDAEAVDVAGNLIGYVPFGLPVGIALQAISQNMSLDSENIKYNLAVKELYTRTISPGKNASGFIYFKLAEKDKLVDRWVFHAKLLNLQRKTPLSFEIPFRFK